jgi:hypothetical protein
LAIGAFAVGTGGVGALCSITSCGEAPTVPYGNPQTLQRSNLPGEAGITTLVCAGDGGSGQSFEGGSPSFALDIYPYFAPTGPWHCGDKNCHGGLTPPNIITAEAGACYASLTQAKVSGSMPLVNLDGGKDPTQSALLCNLQGSCGNKMPQPPGTDPTDLDLCKIQAWLSAGAKND